jgi:hypothetical protein
MPHHQMTPQRSEFISAEEVTLFNADAFEEQLRRDIPHGTPKDVVETYLFQHNIGYVFEPASEFAGPHGNAFYGSIENIGTRVMFSAHLAIRIFLDPEGRVREIVFRVDYDAP